MLYIIYPVGGYGSAIEYCIRNFSVELHDPQKAKIDPIAPNGSMHLYGKDYHANTVPLLQDLHNHDVPMASITYPNHQMNSLELVDTACATVGNHKNVILVKANNLQNKYHIWYMALVKQISTGSIHNRFHAEWWKNRGIDKARHTRNVSVTLSMSEHLYVQPLENWITINFDQFIAYPYDVVVDCISKLDLTLRDEKQLEKFCTHWKSTQQHFLDDILQAQNYVYSALENTEYSFENRNWYQEVILRAWLHDVGYDVSVYEETWLPYNSMHINTLLPKR